MPSSVLQIDRTGAARGFVVRSDAFASEKHMKLLKGVLNAMRVTYCV